MAFLRENVKSERKKIDNCGGRRGDARYYFPEVLRGVIALAVRERREYFLYGGALLRAVWYEKETSIA